MLDPGERSTLKQAARLADSAEGLHAVIDAEGPMVAGSRGQPRLHPAVAELRATRAAIGSLVARLKLPSTHTAASGPGSVTLGEGPGRGTGAVERQESRCMMATLRQPPPGPVDPGRPSLPPLREVCARFGDRSLLDGTGDGWAAFAASAILAYRRTAATTRS